MSMIAWVWPKYYFTVCFRLQCWKVVQGLFPGSLRPEDSRGHPIRVDWHSEPDRAPHLWALLRNQEQHPQHQESSPSGVLHAGTWKLHVSVDESAFGIQLNSSLWLISFSQIARDVDGSGNYFILTHKHMAQVHPLSSYGAQSRKLGLPEWVVFHDYTLSENNCMRTVSEISPQV